MYGGDNLALAVVGALRSRRVDEDGRPTFFEVAVNFLLIFLGQDPDLAPIGFLVHLNRNFVRRLQGHWEGENDGYWGENMKNW